MWPIFQTPFDCAYRIALRVAYPALVVWWRMRSTSCVGCAVAVWHDGRLLFVRHSYKPGYSLPGGGIGRHETAAMAASRELREEVGIDAAPDILSPVGDAMPRDGSNDSAANMFEYRPAGKPDVRIDNREIVEARFVTPEEANELGVGRQMRTYMLQTLERAGVG